MTANTIIGLGLFVAAIVVIVALTLWSRRIIERIHARKPTTLRKLQQELSDD